MEREKLGGKICMEKPLKGSVAKLPKKKSQLLAQQNHSFGKKQLSNHFQAVLDDSSSHSRPQGVEGGFYGDASCSNGAEGSGLQYFENRVSVNIDLKSKKELTELKTKFQSELHQVRNLMKRIEQYNGVKQPVSNGGHGRKLKRVQSEVGSVDGLERKPISESNNGGMRKPVEKVLLPAQSKKPKANGKINKEDTLSIFGLKNSSSKIFKSCSSLLAKMMKSKNGWVFNTPVDVKALGLVDYFTIIKHPMDLGTVKSRLSTNWYKTPDEFAEDVRLTFNNAIKYNMEGHEVNTLAKEFLNLFENKWLGIKADYFHQINKPPYLEADYPTPAPTRPPPPPPEMDMIEDRAEDAKRTSVMASGKSRLPKPKAKDADKRDMTLEEKEKLSESLQNLPTEKLDGVLRIIKKRNPSLYQNDDEIEVDIDTVDNETIWELDRFVIYYKKAVSKMKRSALLGQIGVVVEQNLHEKSGVDGGVEVATENEDDEEKMFSSSSNRAGQEGDIASDSDGSSSSSSDSGSSSSESDADSS